MDQLKLRWWFRFFGNDLFSMFEVWSQHSVKSREMNARARHQGCEFFHEFHWCELNGSGSIISRFFELVDDLASDIGGESFFRNSWTSYVSADFL